MTSTYENGLFIFRRDFRIVDNITLLELNEKCRNIHAIFIFTPEQVGVRNKFKSENAVQFMIESLEDLEKQINKSGGKLHVYYGHNNDIVKQCIQLLNINVVAFNIDYSPYAKQRDQEITKMCKQMKVDVLCNHDYYLHEPGSVVNGTGGPYQKFTPYYETAMRRRVPAPFRYRKIHFSDKSARLPELFSLNDAMRRFTKTNPNILVKGGREEGIKLIKTAVNTQKHYGTTRDKPFLPTSQLSAHIKFGCLSIREVYKAFHGNTMFIRQLYWRDFYASVLDSFPHVLGKSMKSNYNRIRWHYNSAWFKAWCDGNTGFPIVDAGMRQLNTTGYMHNRTRLIVASFLVKTLLISWEHGEQYFATKLTDYDPASNNGNWQWIAGTGADSQPYFRIFNPSEQGKRVDPKCEYIKKWVPELSEVDPNTIHRWEEKWKENKTIQYPHPICDYKKQKELALQMYSSVFK